MAEERLQKILARAGIASRRKAEEYITSGRVTVNGEITSELGAKADVAVDVVKVDARPIRFPSKHVYIALNKPRDVVTTMSDPEGRRTVRHLIERKVKERVFPVGRLDYHSEGLLLLTTDGEFANHISSPKSHVEKTYVAKVNGPLTEEQLAQFRSGVPLHGRRTAPAAIRLIKFATNPWYEITITEGRQNQIRTMFKIFGRLVEKLRRVRIGKLKLDVPSGEFRHLTDKEVANLLKSK